jgi:hypothetical protein
MTTQLNLSTHLYRHPLTIHLCPYHGSSTWVVPSSILSLGDEEQDQLVGIEAEEQDKEVLDHI